MSGFCATQDSDEQPLLLNCLPIVGIAEDILEDLEDMISTLNLRSMKVAKLLSYSIVRGKWYYQFKGEEVTRRPMPYGITELSVMQSFEYLATTDVVPSSSEMEDVETISRTLVEAAFWMDWWFDAAKTVVMKDTKEKVKVQRLFIRTPGRR